MSSPAGAPSWSTWTRKGRRVCGGDLREADRPVVVAAHAPRLARVLDAARIGGADLAVIDTAPHASDAALAAARAADLILVPCRASVADLHAIGASLDVSQVRGQLAAQARQAMADQGAAVAPVMLHQRIAHVHAFTAGQTALEFDPRSKASAELAALYRWTMEERR